MKTRLTNYSINSHEMFQVAYLSMSCTITCTVACPCRLQLLPSLGKLLTEAAIRRNDQLQRPDGRNHSHGSPGREVASHCPCSIASGYGRVGQSNAAHPHLSFVCEDHAELQHKPGLSTGKLPHATAHCSLQLHCQFFL